MRSLTLKLMLAFLLTSVASIVVAAIVIRQSVTREFDSYVIEQERDRFTRAAAAYYAANGSWAGYDRWLRSQAERGSEGLPPPPSDDRRGFLRLRFGLADGGGRLVVGFGRFPPGAALPRSELERGTPIVVDGRTIGTVLTLERSDLRNVAEDRYLARTDMALGIAGLVMLGVAAVLGGLLSGVITRPVRELTAAARKIAAGDLEQRVPVRSRDELGQLAAQFNRMSADLSRAIAQRRQMTADVAHDLRTPLTVIAGYLEALRDKVLTPTPARLAAMYDETRLLLRLVDDLHTLSLADAGELPLDRRPAQPQQLLERAAEMYYHAAERQGVRLRVAAAGELPDIRVDSEQLSRALSNLISNALRYTPSGGTVLLSAELRPQRADGRASDRRGDRRAVLIAVSDTGEGIAEEHLPSIFDRFYRADAARQSETGGSGLGLAIVKSIVEAHGGEISVASAPGQGTTFTIALAPA